MSRTALGLIATPVAIVAILFGLNSETFADAHTSIQALEARFADAVRTKDVDKIMANYANSEDLVVFDVIPPRQYTGWKAYKADWENFLGGCKDNPKFEITDLEINGDKRVAYSHCIQHLSCTTKDGKKLDMTFRVTDGYGNFNREWKITHEHISVPVDLQTGKADLESKP